MPTLAQRRSHLGSGLDTILLEAMPVPTYKSLIYQITFRPAALLFLPSTHHPMLLLCRSRWPWLVNGHLVMLNVLNSHQVGHLPLSHPKDGGQLYLANMGIPKNVYKEVIFWTLRICLRIYSLKNYVRSVSSLPLPLAPSL